MMPSDPQRTVLLRDVAKAAGLSLGGASRALNGDPRISPATRERVKQLAASLGYRPNPAGRALRHLKKRGGESAYRGTIAQVIFPWVEHQLGQPERFPWHQAMAQRSRGLGYQYDILKIDPTKEKQRALDAILMSRGIRGVLLAGGGLDVRQMALSWSHLAVVSQFSASDPPFLHDVSRDAFHDTRHLINQLVARNYLRIGLLLEDHAPPDMIAAYLSTLHTVGLPSFAHLFVHRATPDLVRPWLRRHKIDCVITNAGTNVLAALHGAGYRTPEDIGFCTSDTVDDPVALSGMKQPRVELAKLAVDVLHGMLSNNEYGPPETPMKIQLEAIWNEGHHVRPVAAAASPSR